MPNVEVYPRKRSEPDDVLELGFEHVVVATGASGGAMAWRASTPPDPDRPEGAKLLARRHHGRAGAGRAVMLYDDDHFYMGSVIAEVLVRAGLGWTSSRPPRGRLERNTLEQGKIQRRLLEIGVR